MSSTNTPSTPRKAPQSIPSPSDAALANILISAYDSLLLASQLSSHPSKPVLNSLALINRLLVGASIGGPDAKSGLRFIKLQNKLELNASLVLLRWLSQVSDSLLPPHPSELDLDRDLIDQVARAFVLLQGLLHLHPPSQRLFSSQFNLRILLAFLPPALGSTTFYPLALPLLDLLLTSFIDAPLNAQLFEAAGGLEMLVRAMKQRGLATAIRVKVLETIWGWWIDDGAPGGPPSVPPSMAPAYPSPPLSAAPAHAPAPVQTRHPSGSSASSVERAHTPRVRDRPRVRPAESTPLRPAGTPRARPISLPPPRLSDDASGAPATLSDGHETPRAPAHPQTPRRGVPATPIGTRTPKASDPASRLRLMLESTAGEFVPGTPQHGNRTRPLTPGAAQGTPRRAHALHQSHPQPAPGRPDVRASDSEESDRLDVSPTRLFSARDRRLAKEGGNTPQRMLRHKQSASMGSIQAQLGMPMRGAGRRSSDEGGSGSEHEGRARGRTDRGAASPLAGVRSPPVGRAPTATRRPATGLPNQQSATESDEARAGDVQFRRRSGAKRAVVGVPDSPRVKPVSPRKAGGTPMRSTVGKALVVGTPVSPGKTLLSRPRSPTVHVNQSDLEMMVNGTDSDVGMSFGKEQEKKRGLLEKYMSNSDELVKSFKAIGEGLELLSHHRHQHQREKIGGSGSFLADNTGAGGGGKGVGSGDRDRDRDRGKKKKT